MAKPADVKVFIDPFTHHFQNDVLFDLNFDRLGGDDILAPWVYLRDWFQARGVEVHTADRLLRGEGLGAKNIYISFGIQEHYRLLAKRADVTLSAYFAFEGPIVEPRLYRGLPRLQPYFKRVFGFTDSESLKPFIPGEVKLRQFHLPTPFDKIHEDIWHQEDRGFMVMITTNRLPRLYYNELYTERRRAIDFFARTGDIDLYGKGWEGPSLRVGKTRVPYTFKLIHNKLTIQWQRFRPDPLLEACRRVYLGPTWSKRETLGRYNFALCFDNQVLNGWITEKIFDCFFAGAVPVYLGAPDIETYIPKECFVDVRDFANYEELRRYLKSLGEKEIRKYKEAGRKFIESPKFQPFTKAAFTDLVARIVEEDAGLNLINKSDESLLTTEVAGARR